MKTLLAVLLVGALILSATAVAHPLSPCAPRSALVKFLGEEYGEELTAHGTTAKGKELVELLIADDESWSVMVTRTNGNACVLVSGEGWKNFPLPVPERTPPLARDTNK